MRVLEFQIDGLEFDEESGAVSMRVVPWGETIRHDGQRLMFDRGAIDGDRVALTVDHGRGVLDRIGLVRVESRDDALYGVATVADTQAGRDVRELLRLGAVTDVSAGVRVDADRTSVDDAGVAHKFGSLDHVSVVVRGAFGEAGEGSKVLAVHSEQEVVVDEQTEAPAEGGSVELAREIESLRAAIVELNAPGGVVEPVREFADLRDFVLTVAKAGKGDRRAAERLGEYQLADDTTTGAAGVVPDYISGEVLSIVDTTRAFVGSLPSDPIGSAGMAVNYPRVTQKPSVDEQSAEKTEVESQATLIDVVSVGLRTYAGASDVSIQLIERSDPSFVNLLFREYAGVYAQRTEVAAWTNVQAAVTQTADLDLTDPTEFIKNLAAANTQVINGVRRPANTLWLSTSMWEGLIALTDSAGRPIVNFPESTGVNSLASGSLAVMRGSLAGIACILVPDADADTGLFGWSEAAATLEQNPQELRALQVSLLGMDMGVYGLFSEIVKYPAGLVKVSPAPVIP